MSIFVTNNSDQDLKDGFGGVFYNFVQGSTVEIPNRLLNTFLVTKRKIRLPT